MSRMDNADSIQMTVPIYLPLCELSVCRIAASVCDPQALEGVLPSLCLSVWPVRGSIQSHQRKAVLNVTSG